MIWDGTIDCLHQVRKLHPSAVIYAMQTKTPAGDYINDPYYGVPVLVIEDRKAQPGRVFEIGEEVV